MNPSSPTALSQPPAVVSIAGIDPSGGAGVLADIKTFSALGAYGCGIITALTAQNTQGVSAIHMPPAIFLRQQIDTLFTDVTLHAVKLGMLGTRDIIVTVSEALQHWQPINLVLDPVMVAQSGHTLLEKDAIALLHDALLPLAELITPNLPEAGILLNQRAPESRQEMFRAIERLRDKMAYSGQRWVLLKGGHLPGGDLLDLLFDGDRMIELPLQRIDTRHTHGTGCTLSSAITALLPQYATQPNAMETAVRHAQRWLHLAIAAASQLHIGRGCGPVHHFHAQWS